MDLELFQADVYRWNAFNFPGKIEAGDSDQPFKGLMEELGELAHADLKLQQGIRGDENLEAMRADAVGDLMVFLADYCNLVGIDMDEVLRETWSKVRMRNWRKYPDSKGIAPGATIEWSDGVPYVSPPEDAEPHEYPPLDNPPEAGVHYLTLAPGHTEDKFPPGRYMGTINDNGEVVLTHRVGVDEAGSPG
jgi:NTP pyrophosphatase (non-canonical NTP hydrolase)